MKFIYFTKLKTSLFSTTLFSLVALAAASEVSAQQIPQVPAIPQDACDRLARRVGEPIAVGETARVVTPLGDGIKRYFFIKNGRYTLVTVRAAIVEGGEVQSFKIPVNVWKLSEARNGTCTASDPQVTQVEVGLVNADYGSRFAVLGSTALSGNQAAMLFTVPH